MDDENWFQDNSGNVVGKRGYFIFEVPMKKTSSQASCKPTNNTNLKHQTNHHENETPPLFSPSRISILHFVACARILSPAELKLRSCVAIISTCCLCSVLQWQSMVLCIIFVGDGTHIDQRHLNQRKSLCQQLKVYMLSVFFSHPPWGERGTSLF